MFQATNATPGSEARFSLHSPSLQQFGDAVEPSAVSAVALACIKGKLWSTEQVGINSDMSTASRLVLQPHGLVKGIKSGEKTLISRHNFSGRMLLGDYPDLQ